MGAAQGPGGGAGRPVARGLRGGVRRAGGPGGARAGWVPFPHRSPDLRQPQEVHRLYVDQEHPRADPVSHLHHGQRAPPPGLHHHPLHRALHRHRERHPVVRGVRGLLRGHGAGGLVAAAVRGAAPALGGRARAGAAGQLWAAVDVLAAAVPAVHVLHRVLHQHRDVSDRRRADPQDPAPLAAPAGALPEPHPGHRHRVPGLHRLLPLLLPRDAQRLQLHAHPVPMVVRPDALWAPHPHLRRDPETGSEETPRKLVGPGALLLRWRLHGTPGSPPGLLGPSRTPGSPQTPPKIPLGTPNHPFHPLFASVQHHFRSPRRLGAISKPPPHC
ncbi:potassium-transporting ATPase alpha chain 1-like, partial [Columba livia]